MFSILFLSLIGLSPAKVGFSQPFEAANVCALRVETWEAQEGADRAHHPSPARAFTTTDVLAASVVEDSPETPMARFDADADGCVANGNVLYQRTSDLALFPVINEYDVSYYCDNGTTITRHCTHTVHYRHGVHRWTTYRSSPLPGVECPPLVYEIPYTEVSSETFSYSGPETCSGVCCLLQSTNNSIEYGAQIKQFPEVVTFTPITCPDGSTGVKITKEREYYREARSITKQKFVSQCESVTCPPTITTGHWYPVVIERVTEVIIECPQPASN